MKRSLSRAGHVFAALCLIAAGGLGCASTPAKRDWRVIEGHSFVIYTDADAEDGRAFYDRLESFRAAVRWYTGLRREASAKTRVMLFKSSAAALPYLVSKDAGGWASVTASGNLAVAKLEGRQKQLDEQTVRRDLVLLMLQDAQMRTPRWYAEGLAELASAFDIQDDGVTVGNIPVALAGFDALIADEKKGHTPGALLGEEPISKYTVEDRARVWLTVHYLMVGGDERKEALQGYFRVWLKGTPSPEAFKSAFGQSPEDFFRLEVSRYGTRSLRLGKFSPQLAVDANPSVRDASQDEIEQLTNEVEHAAQRMR